MDNYGLALRILRRRFDMTQTELAEKIGVSNHAVSKWENGINQPDVSTLQTICKLFNITMDQFMRLSAGESEEIVFKKEDVEVGNKVVVVDKRKFLILLICIISALVVTLTVGIVFLVRGLQNSQEETVLTGSQKTFLKNINNAITLKDGISEYDYVAKLSSNDKTLSTTSAKLVVDKKKGKYKRCYVKHPKENIDVFSDFEYFYITDEYGQKLRLNKNAYDISDYFEDLETLYTLDNLTTISARKIGKTYEYSYGFNDAFIKEETKEAFEELDGAIIVDSKATFIISNNSTCESITIQLLYQGRDYEITVTRQLNLKSNFIFPDFSQYKEGVDVSESLNDIEIYLQKTKNLKNYKKTILKNSGEVFSLSTTSSSGVNSIATDELGRFYYYVNGKTYDTVKHYKCYSVKSYNEFLESVTEGLSLKTLLYLDFDIKENYVGTILTEDNSYGCKYTVYLSQSGIDYVEDKLNCTIYDDAKMVFTVKNDIFSKIEIFDESKSYVVEIDKNPTLTFPDFSSYGALNDGSNVIAGVESTKVNQDQFDSETLVDKNTGDVYTFDGVKLVKYGKNHNILREYALVRPSASWSNIKLLGINNYRLYYAVFYSYVDFSSDNKVYYLDFSTGNCQIVESNYSRTKMPVAFANGIIIYESYNNGFSFEHDLTSESFVHYDVANNLLIIDGYKDGERYSGVYDYNTYTFRKEKYESIDCCLGEGFFNSNLIYRTYASIGTTQSEIKYFKVIDMHPNRYYQSQIDANWQIVKDTAKYTFTTYGVYEKYTGNFVYFPKMAEYRFFNGGVHVWDSKLNFVFDEMTWYTFLY